MVTTSRQRILIVDDEKPILTLIGIMLERGGFGVLSAEDAYRALDILENDTPDLIILDIMMPGMDGIELCSVIRARPKTQRTPILILSARGDADAILRGMNAGANDYLQKPVLHNDILTKLRTMLGG